MIVARHAYAGQCYDSTDARSDPRRPIPAEQFLGDVRSVLRSMDSNECIAVLHPRGTIIRYKDAAATGMSGKPYLAWMDNTPAEGMIISRQTLHRMKLAEVVLHGCAPGTTPPTPHELATAPYVNRRARVRSEAPRTVRWF